MDGIYGASALTGGKSLSWLEVSGGTVRKWHVRLRAKMFSLQDDKRWCTLVSSENKPASDLPLRLRLRTIL